MKPVLAWIKANLVIVICIAVIVLSLPTAWFFSSRWNRSIRDQQQTKAANELKNVEGAKVTYTLPALMPGEQSVTVSYPPNLTMIDWFKAHREKIIEQAEGVVKQAVAINQRNHGPLVEGLFPEAPVRDAQLKAIELIERIVGKPGRPSIYVELLQSVGAGAPVDEQTVVTAVQDMADRRKEQLLGGVNRTLSNDEQTELSKQLVERRLGEYKRRAAEISFYAGMEVFPQGLNTGSFVPRTIPAQAPTIAECFIWNCDYWVYQDVFAAIAAANTGADGTRTSVDRSVVKRVDRVVLFDDWLMRSDAGGAVPAATEGDGRAAVVATKFENSITGRVNAPDNPVYDVRKVQLTVVASSSRLPELINAISNTNFMTVIDCDLTEVDPWADLEKGYYYGSEHVVRAKLVIETIWLRSWILPMMPDTVRDYLGLPHRPKPEAAPADGAGAPDAAGGKNKGG